MHPVRPASKGRRKRGDPDTRGDLLSKETYSSVERDLIVQIASFPHLDADRTRPNSIKRDQGKRAGRSMLMHSVCKHVRHPARSFVCCLPLI